MLGDFLRILFTVLLVMDPIGIIPQFLSITVRFDAETRKRIVLKAILIAGVVLLVFLLMGKILLDFFGIMPGAFYISGGILFFMIAFGMIYSRPELPRSVPSKKSAPEDTAGAPAAGRGSGAEKDGVDKDSPVSVALFPLAIPLIAGPGLLTVLVMFITHGESWLYSFSLLLPALVISLVAAFITLRCSTLLLKFFGSMGIFVMEKIMGLILAGFAVQFIYDGLLALGIIHP
jgi:multiple antibiotic resistance protein